MASTYRAAATTSWAGSTTGTITIPAGVSNGDWGLLVVTSSALSSIASLTTPPGWTVVVSHTDFGTGSYAIYKRQFVTGDTAISIVKGDSGTAFVANAVWYYGGEGFSAPGAANARSSSTTTTFAPAHAEAADYGTSLAICVGKTSTSLSVDAGTTRSSVFYGASSGHPYSAIVEYPGVKASRTFTSSDAGASGLGQQIALVDTGITPSGVALNNSFEGIPDNTAITPGNSGGASGDAFDAVAGTMIARSSSALNGDRGAYAELASSTDSYVAWNVTGSVHYVRRYIRFGGLPVNHNMRLMWGTSAGAPVWEVRLIMDNNAIDVTVGGTQRMVVFQAPATGIQAGVLYRLEAMMDSGTGSGALRVYQGHSTTMLASDTWSGTLGTIDQVRFGNRNGGNVTSTNHVDDVAYRNNTWPGPASYVNTAPDISAGADFAAEPWSVVTLTATGTDDTGIVDYAWSQSSGPTVTLSGSGASRTFTAPAAIFDQTFVFQVTATDEGGLTTTDSVTVVVMASTECIADGGQWRPAQIIIHSDEF